MNLPKSKKHVKVKEELTTNAWPRTLLTLNARLRTLSMSNAWAGGLPDEQQKPGTFFLSLFSFFLIITFTSCEKIKKNVLNGPNTAECIVWACFVITAFHRTLHRIICRSQHISTVKKKVSINEIKLLNGPNNAKHVV